MQVQQFKGLNVAADRIQFVGQGAGEATVTATESESGASAYTVLSSADTQSSVNAPAAAVPASTWTFSEDMSAEEQERIQGMFAMMQQSQQ